ncbi:MAG: ATP-dependent DNA helicase DinG [Oleiphilaceae bacterium]|nr:ATP-dependent DNA helicase DinG [Oleiphilaceae bacterium]
MLSDQQKNLIQSSYRKFTAREGFKPRYGQRVMIAEIAKYIGSIEQNDEGLRTSDPAVCVVEAGTGTGKTLAYSIAVLPLALEQGRKVVISTATTALQEQVLAKDLPELAKHSGLQFDYALAKGRGRYLCVSKLDQHLQKLGGDQSALPLFIMDGGAADELDQATLEGFLSAYASGDWDGDRDSWPQTIDNDVWRQITTDNQQCSNRRCSYFSTCPYYESRKRWDDADVIVANHDLVLSDLALGGGVILPSPESAFYVFDEAHHLADKALGHFTVAGALKAMDNWLKSLSKSLAELLPYLGPSHFLQKQIADSSATNEQLHHWLTQAYEFIATGIAWQEEEGSTGKRYRFAEGEIPENLQAMAVELKQLFASTCRLLDAIRSEVTKAVDEKSDCGLSKEEGEQWFPVIGSLCNRAESYFELWSFYAKERREGAPPDARWMVFRDQENQSDIWLYGSPLSAGGVLREALWKKSYGAILTSATMTALGRFDRLAAKTGLPEASVYHRVPSPFHFGEVATLRVPAMQSDPGNSEAHTNEIVEQLEDWMGDHQAVLVLFSSRKQMNDVFYGVDRDLREDILTQDDLGKQELVETHKRKIDRGQRSILFGLASLAEGIDLPGKYLSHVIIAKIPFSVPNDPLEQSVSEWLEAQGRNPFMEISVPDASLKLIQACGRLIRTEEDRGDITILDRRLLTRRYGSMLINALPPYKQNFSS